MALTVQRTKFGPVDIVGIDRTDSLGINTGFMINQNIKTSQPKL